MQDLKALMATMPFHANILTQLQLREERLVPTAAVVSRGGRMHVSVNPEFMAGLKLKERLFVLAHEAEHIARFHLWRAKGRQQRIWNIACDLLINGTLTRYGLKLPGDTRPVMLAHLLDKDVLRSMVEQANASGMHLVPCDSTITHMAEEEIYDKLIEALDQALAEALDLVDDHDQTDGADDEKARVRTAIAVAAAAQATPSNLRGSIPGAALEEIRRLRNYRSAVNWRRKLARFIGRGANREDFTYSRPNLSRMAVSPDIIAPAIVRYGAGTVVVVIDTSASMHRDELAVGLAETAAMLKQARPEKVVLMEADVEVQREHEIRAASLASWTPPVDVYGRGGTSFTEPLQKAMEHKPDMIIYFTDGEGDDPDPVPIPVMWCLTKGEACSASFGEVVKLEV